MNCIYKGNYDDPTITTNEQFFFSKKSAKIDEKYSDKTGAGNSTIMWFLIQALYVLGVRIAMLQNRRSVDYDPAVPPPLWLRVLGIGMYASSGFMIIVSVYFCYYDTGARICAGLEKAPSSE